MTSRWTPEDDARLIDWWAAGLPPDVIAAGLSRTRRAVYRRVERLRAAGQLGAPSNAYLPGSGTVVPCVNCGQSFTRIRVTQSLCSHQCDLDYHRTGRTVTRGDGICPRCGVNPRPARPTGLLRSWCRPCETAQKSEYMRSDAGKAAWRRWYHRRKAQLAAEQAS